MRDDLEIPYASTGPFRASAYQPQDYRSTGIDPNTRRMAIIAGGIGAALLLLMGVWSVTGHKRAGVPVIEADNRPVRERPVNKGGLEVEGANESILSGGTEGKTVVAAAPEAPAIAALMAKTATPTPAPLPPAPAPAVRVSGLADVPEDAMLNASRPTAPKPPVATIAPPPPAPAAAGPIAAAPASIAAAPAPAAARPQPPRPVAHSGTQVQLAAVGSEEAARTEWARLSRKYPDLLGGRSPAFTRTDHDGKTFWRVRVTGFSDVPSATSFCGELKSKGGSCALASF